MAVCIIEILNSDNSLIVKHGKPPHFIAIPLRSLLSIPLDETEVIRVDSNCDIDEFIIALFHCECIAEDRKPILTTTPTGLIDKPDRKSTRLNSSNYCASRMPSSAGKKNTT